MSAALVSTPVFAADAPPEVGATDASAIPVAGAAIAEQAQADAAALVRDIRQNTTKDAALADWTRGVLEQAMTRAGTEAGPAEDAAGIQGGIPLSAEHGAGAIATGLSGRGDAATVLVFMSLSVPAPSWRQWAAESARAGVPLVLRGPSPDGLRATIQEAGARLGGADAGIAFDPRLFRLFDITRVPAVIAVPDGVPPCASRGCADDAPPPFDRVTGNTGLVAALSLIAAEGEAGRDTAREHLEKPGVRP